MTEKTYNSIVALLFSLYIINGIVSIPRLSITYDEGANLSYAIRLVKGHPEKVLPYNDASTMPLLVFNTIPRIVEQLKNPQLVKNDNGYSDIMAGRYITLFLIAFTGLFVLKWSNELFGKAGGVLSLFLFVFCPNLNANAILVTTDASSALFTVATAYYFHKLFDTGKWKYVFSFAIILALAQLTKQSLTHLLIIFPLLTILLLVAKRSRLVFTKNNLLKVVIGCIVYLIIINAGFLFYGTGQPLSAYHFKSVFFQRFQDFFSFAGDIPLPFPEPYLSGLDLTKNMDEMGPGLPETSGNVHILGESRTKTGFWYYYFVSLFFKTPVPVLILSVVFIILLIKRKIISNGLLVIPAFCILYFLIYFSFFYNSQVGIRHILMIFPLWYVLLGGVAPWLLAKKKLASILLVYSTASFYTFFPNLYAYSNEFILNKKWAYHILGNANIDYGHGYYFLHHYLEQHPEVKMAPEKPAVGKFILTTADYLDVNNTGQYKWIRKYKPVAAVEYCYLLFDITEEDIESHNLE